MLIIETIAAIKELKYCFLLKTSGEGAGGKETLGRDTGISLSKRK